MSSAWYKLPSTIHRKEPALSTVAEFDMAGINARYSIRSVSKRTR